MERENASEETDRERPAVTRGQNVLAVIPPDESSLGQLLEPVMERLARGEPGIQAVALTPDAATASAIARVASREMRAIPVSSVPRAERLLRSGTPTLLAGPPSALLQLVRKSAIKLEGVRAVVLAWADAIVEVGEGDALEALLSELPKDSARIVATSRMTPAVEQLVERYARRPRRAGGEVAAHAAAREIRYVSVAERSRPDALRRLLDDLDPERAVIYAREEASERELREALRGAGYADDDSTVRVARGGSDYAAGVDPGLVVLYDFPPSRDVVDALAGATGGEIVALVRPRQLGALRAIAAGGEVRPFTLSGPAARARRGEEVVRDELRAVLADASPTRELLALEPLLAEYDGVELAAAALRLLERERSRRVATPQPAAPAAAAARQSGSHLTVFINAGSRDGVTPGDLVGAISGESGITSDRIGRIDVRENHSLVEIAPEVAERVVEKMTGASVKGRRVVARVDRERASDAERGRPRDRERSAGRPERGERGERRERGERPMRGDRDRGSRGPRDRGAPRAPRGPRGPRPS